MSSCRGPWRVELPSSEALATQGARVGLAVPVVALVALEVLEAQEAAGALATLMALRSWRRGDAYGLYTLALPGRLLALGRVAAHGEG